MTTFRRVALVLGLLLAVAVLVVFALYNRGNPVALEFGFARWGGEAVYALYGAVFVGLLLMFLVGLPVDLAARRERRRLERRVRELARRSADPSRPDEADVVEQPGETARSTPG